VVIIDGVKYYKATDVSELMSDTSEISERLNSEIKQMTELKEITVTEMPAFMDWFVALMYSGYHEDNKKITIDRWKLEWARRQVEQAGGIH